MDSVSWWKSAAIAVVMAFPCGAGFAQDVAYNVQAATPAYAPSQTELDQLLAPVALYPDPLLGNILAASTYPLEVVALARWLERNPNVTGADLEQAVAQQPWDTSVKSLAPFGGVVKMMNGELDWMQRLGHAFLADEAGVFDTVQRLRQKARGNGSLADNEHERVVVDDTIIRIEPAQPDVIYVPYYDPAVVYGPWWWPGYPPYAWGSYYGGPWDYFWGGIAFGGIWVSGGWHGHHPQPDWHGRHLVHRDPHRAGQHVWNHDPSHRIGVPYADNRTHERYRAATPAHDPNRQAYRGFDVRPGAHAPSQASRPSVATPRPHALQPAPNPIARQQSARGQQSLASRPGGNPIARAPSGGSHGGGSHGGGGHR